MRRVLSLSRFPAAFRHPLCGMPYTTTTLSSSSSSSSPSSSSPISSASTSVHPHTNRKGLAYRRHQSSVPNLQQQDPMSSSSDASVKKMTRGGAVIRDQPNPVLLSFGQQDAQAEAPIEKPKVESLKSIKKAKANNKPLGEPTDSPTGMLNSQLEAYLEGTPLEEDPKAATADPVAEMKLLREKKEGLKEAAAAAAAEKVDESEKPKDEKPEREPRPIIPIEAKQPLEPLDLTVSGAVAPGEPAPAPGSKEAALKAEKEALLRQKLQQQQDEMQRQQQQLLDELKFKLVALDQKLKAARDMQVQAEVTVRDVTKELRSTCETLEKIASKGGFVFPHQVMNKPNGDHSGLASLIRKTTSVGQQSGRKRPLNAIGHVPESLRAYPTEKYPAKSLMFTLFPQLSSKDWTTASILEFFLMMLLPLVPFIILYSMYQHQAIREQLEASTQLKAQYVPPSKLDTVVGWVKKPFKWVYTTLI